MRYIRRLAVWQHDGLQSGIVRLAVWKHEGSSLVFRKRKVGSLAASVKSAVCQSGSVNSAVWHFFGCVRSAVWRSDSANLCIKMMIAQFIFSFLLFRELNISSGFPLWAAIREMR